MVPCRPTGAKKHLKPVPLRLQESANQLLEIAYYEGVSNEEIEEIFDSVMDSYKSKIPSNQPLNRKYHSLNDLSKLDLRTPFLNPSPIIWDDRRDLLDSENSVKDRSLSISGVSTLSYDTEDSLTNVEDFGSYSSLITEAEIKFINDSFNDHSIANPEIEQVAKYLAETGNEKINTDSIDKLVDDGDMSNRDLTITTDIENSATISLDKGLIDQDSEIPLEADALNDNDELPLDAIFVYDNQTFNILPVDLKNEDDPDMIGAIKCLNSEAIEQDINMLTTKNQGIALNDNNNEEEFTEPVLSLEADDKSEGLMNFSLETNSLNDIKDLPLDLIIIDDNYVEFSLEAMLTYDNQIFNILSVDLKNDDNTIMTEAIEQDINILDEKDQVIKLTDCDYENIQEYTEQVLSLEANEKSEVPMNSSLGTNYLNDIKDLPLDDNKVGTIKIGAFDYLTYASIEQDTNILITEIDDIAENQLILYDYMDEKELVEQGISFEVDESSQEPINSSLDSNSLHEIKELPFNTEQDMNTIITKLQDIKLTDCDHENEKESAEQVFFLKAADEIIDVTYNENDFISEDVKNSPFETEIDIIGDSVLVNSLDNDGNIIARMGGDFINNVTIGIDIDSLLLNAEKSDDESEFKDIQIKHNE